MLGSPAIRPEALEQWLSGTIQQHYVALLLKRIGMTRRRADCFGSPKKERM